MVQAGSQKYRLMFKDFLLSYLVCSPIWLNLPMNIRQFAHIRKLTQKNTVLELFNLQDAQMQGAYLICNKLK
jgi:hypothetical protein